MKDPILWLFIAILAIAILDGSQCQVQVKIQDKQNTK